MTYSLVKNGNVISTGNPRPKRVDNTFIGSNSDIRQFGYYPETGDRPNTGQFQRAVVDSAVFNGDVVEVTYRIEQLPPPTSISDRQGMAQLIIAGLDEQVEAAIDAISDPVERKLTRNWFQRAKTWERDNAQLQSLSTALGLTEQQVDDLFTAASQL